MSEILLWIILVIVSITLILIGIGIYYARPEYDEEEEEEEEEEEVESKQKVKQNATALKFLKPHPKQIGADGRIVIVLESKTNAIGMCLSLAAIAQLYNNLGTLLRYENCDFEGGEDSDDEEEEEFTESEMPQIKTKINVKSEKVDLRNLYS